MRKLYRDKGTGEFLCTNGDWTRDPKLACDFMVNGTSELHLKARGNRVVEWLYAFDDLQWDFTIELSPLLVPVKRPPASR